MTAVPTPVLRTAVVGLGWAGRAIWLPRLLRHPRYQVVAAVEPHPGVREAAAAEFPGVPAVSSVDELPAVDLAIVAVPNHLHATVACGLLERGLSVFVEKPVCLTSTEAERLADAERAGGVLLAGSAARYRADVGALYAVAATLGPLRHLEAEWVRAQGVPGAGGWFTDRSRSGGGALVDLGWHLLDTVAPLLGGAAIEQAAASFSGDFIAARSAEAGWRNEARVDGTIDVEDTARGFLVTDTGVSVALRASWASHETFDVTRLRVSGSAGEALLTCTFGFSPNRAGSAALTVTRHGRTEPVELPADEVGAEYDRQLDDLPDLLSDPDSRGRAVGQAATTIALIERLYASARTPGFAASARTPLTV